MEKGASFFAVLIRVVPLVIIDSSFQTPSPLLELGSVGPTTVPAASGRCFLLKGMNPGLQHPPFPTSRAPHSSNQNPSHLFSSFEGGSHFWQLASLDYCTVPFCSMSNQFLIILYTFCWNTCCASRFLNWTPIDIPSIIYICLAQTEQSGFLIFILGLSKVQGKSV